MGAGLRIRLGKNDHAGPISPVLARAEIFTHGCREDCSISRSAIPSNIRLALKLQAYYAYKFRCRADEGVPGKSDGTKFWLYRRQIKPSENSPIGQLRDGLQVMVAILSHLRIGWQFATYIVDSLKKH